MERTVNIIGMGGSQIAAPLDDGERWGINFAFKLGKLDKLFFMEHINSWLPHQETMYAPQDYMFSTFLKDNPHCELISIRDEDIVDTDKKYLGHINSYPLHLASTLNPGAYFTSTVAYMIVYTMIEIPARKMELEHYQKVEALETDTVKKEAASKKVAELKAIIDKIQPVKRIRLYGLEAWSGGDACEYNYQRPCLEYWLAFAQGRGIYVEIPYYMMHTNNSHQNFYGYFDFNTKHGAYKLDGKIV